MTNRTPLLLVFLFSVCFSQAQTSVNGAEFQAYGRSRTQPGQELELITSAAHIGWIFKGDSCTFVVRATSPGAHSYLQYELDGQYMGRFRVNGDGNQAFGIQAQSKGTHTVWLYKTTEAHSGALWVKAVSGKKIRSLLKAQMPTIEFIGNSITCGAAADASDIPCSEGEYLDHHNAYWAYGPRIARELGAEYMLSSVSGYGVYRNWDVAGPTLPDVYEKVDLHNSTAESWDFSRFSPDVVSIALGTNDFSGGDGRHFRPEFRPDSFVQTYIAFVKRVKGHYPNARIALLSSPMVQGENDVVFRDCLNRVKAEIDQAYPADFPVSLFFFEPMEASGCSGHPSIADHGIMAEQAMDFFRGLLPE